jgi:hypothetical protein
VVGLYRIIYALWILVWLVESDAGDPVGLVESRSIRVRIWARSSRNSRYGRSAFLTPGTFE